jgi:ubiquinone/menaquinone biosynthesis C-methylase UbiE
MTYRFTAIFYIVYCAFFSASAQDNIICIGNILNTKNDSIFTGVADYSVNISKYKKFIAEADQMVMVIKKSSLSTAEQKIFIDLIAMLKSDMGGNVYENIKTIDRSTVTNLNKCVPLVSIYELNKLALEIKKWASEICTFMQNDSTNYFDANHRKVPDSAFENEVVTYKFDRNDVIADIGAGSGYFERILSMYSDSLIVFVNDIDSIAQSKLQTKLKFLELQDQKNIRYHTVLGNEKSTLLTSNTFDKLIIRNAFHHFSYPNDMLQDCKRIMKKNGKLFIVDILADETDQKPQCNLHHARQVFTKYLKDNGFILINETKLCYDNFKCFEFKIDAR